MKATLKSIPVSGIIEGTQAILYVNNNWIIGTISQCALGLCLKQVGEKDILVDKDELKTIVVEYVEKCSVCRGLCEVQQSDTEWDNCRRCDGRGVEVKQLPIKHSDWQQVIDDRSLNSGKEVEIEILYGGLIDENTQLKVVQLILQQKSEEDFEQLAEIWVNDRVANGDNKTVALYKNGFIDGYKAAQQKRMYSEEDMLNFAWFLIENVGQYSCDRTAHFQGEYLKKFKYKQP
jgi:hypothetical protein